MNARMLHENLHFQVLCKMNFSQVGVGQVINMEVHDFHAVVKYGVKS